MYLDPGTGSIILQVVIAGLLGAGVIVKMFWNKIKSVFVKKETLETKSDNIEK